MKKKIHYIGQYSEKSSFRNLRVFPSAVTKMNYIITCLIKCGHEVKVFSPAETKNTFISYYPPLNKQINERQSVSYIGTFGCPNLLFRVFSRLWTFFQIINYLLFYVEREDIILIYHVWMYRVPLNVVKHIRKIEYILEVEEVYNAAWKRNHKAIEKELRYIQRADSYILVNDLIRQFISVNKPSIVCYGSYLFYKSGLGVEIDDSVHLVYAGVIEDINSDIYLAINTLQYLPPNYSLNILGYGTKNNIERLISAISDINFSLKRTAVKFIGSLEGDEYYSFLAKSDIGLCPRVLEDYYSDFTFPSKILVYLGCSLITVSTPIQTLLKSKLNNYLIFSNEVSSLSLAQAILSVNIKNKPDFMKILNDLDSKFCSDLLLLIN